jgi:hypothetical protein
MRYEESSRPMKHLLLVIFLVWVAVYLIRRKRRWRDRQFDNHPHT